VLYYAYHAFVQSWRVSTALGYLWSQLALDALTMADYEFDRSSLTFDMGAFRVDIFSEYGDVPRALVVAVANPMMVHSRRGVCGCFNARVVTNRDTSWVTMRVTDI